MGHSYNLGYMSVVLMPHTALPLSSCPTSRRCALEEHGKVDLIELSSRAIAHHSTLGIGNMVFATGQAAGAPLGGYFADTIGWRWSFGLQVPLAMLAIVSVGIANLLILQRVVILWEHRPVRPSAIPHTRSLPS